MARAPTSKARCPECEGKIRRTDFVVRFSARGALLLTTAMILGFVGVLVGVVLGGVLGARTAFPAILGACMAPALAVGGSAYRSRERVGTCRSCGWSGTNPPKG